MTSVADVSAIASGVPTLQPTDMELVRAAADGDGAAFHVLVDRHSGSLFRVALSLSSTRADAEDILQETFTGAFRGLAKFNGRSSVRTWLTQILVRRAAKTWHRSRRWRSSVPMEAIQSVEHLSTRSGRPEDADHRIDLLEALKTLAPDHRQVIVLRELQGLSYEEMAQALRVPRGTIESRLHRARAVLREKLTGYV